MILHFQGSECAQFPSETAQMFQLRARYVRGRLRSSFEYFEGSERDTLDSMNPLYLLAIEKEKIVGALRLLSTVGPTLLNGPLQHEFSQSVDFRSPLIFERTRVAIDRTYLRRTPAGVRVSTAELLMANCQLLLQAGALHVIGVVDSHALSIYRKCGWAPCVVARSHRDPRVLVALWEVSRRILGRMTKIHGFAPEFYRRFVVKRIAS